MAFLVDSPYHSSPARSVNDYYDQEDEDYETLTENSSNYLSDTGSDTEDASETEANKLEEEFIEMKEQIYQEKLAGLKKQLQQLKEGVHPEYNKRLKKIEQTYKDRLRMSDIFKMFEMESVERNYVREKKMVTSELEDKKHELKEALVVELEEKKKQIEMERNVIELTGDSLDMKPITTRKLRRRPNDPIPLPEKRRKASPAALNYLLSEDEVNLDLKMISKNKPITTRRQNSIPEGGAYQLSVSYDARIEDGRLYYDKHWFHKGQSIFLENKDSSRVTGIISSVGTTDVVVRKLVENSKQRVYISQLQKGKYLIRKRSSAST